MKIKDSLFKLLKKNKREFFRQILTYLYLNILIAMIVMLNPFVAGVASFVLHVAGVLVGMVFVIFNHKYINTNLDKIFRQELTMKASKWNLLWFSVPVFFVVTCVAL